MTETNANTKKSGPPARYQTSDGKRMFGDFNQAQIYEAGMILARMKAIKDDANFMLIVADVVNAFNKIQGHGIPPHVMNAGGPPHYPKR